MLLFLQIIFTEIISQCKTSTKGLVLTKYYRSTCPHCERIAPLLAEAHDILQKNKIKIQLINVECAECDCRVANITAVPTIVLARDGLELGRFQGYREYDFIADFISKKGGISMDILTERTESKDGQVLKLKVSDFYTAFHGPWLILFYDAEDDVKRQLVKEIADIYSGKIQVGEIYKSDAESIEVRYNIQKYPTIVGMYGNANVEFRGENLSKLMDFCEKLLEPSFKEIELPEFISHRDALKSGDPIFIVFYTNITKANALFNEVAKDFKFRTKFFKTGDSKIFELAGIHPTTNEDVLLVVYRNNVFYRYPLDISNTPELYDWLFHAHYPHVSLFSEKNFQTLFYGIKPLVILITRNEEFIDKFEQVSKDRHLGLPFATEIFVAMDMKDFSTFAKVFFPGHKTPSLLIYDPISKKIFSEKRRITQININNETHRMLRLYDTNKLPELRRGYWSLMWLIGVVLIGLFAGYYGGVKKNFVKID